MKVPVIYILSNGRSGSTILDLMLGSFPNLWTLGEAQLLPLEIDFNAICGSGEPILESFFWKDLIPSIQLEDNNSSISYFRRSHPHGAHTGAVIRWKLLYELFTAKFSKDTLGRVESYGKLNYDYFKKTIHHAEQNGFANKVEWIVDASKDPYRLMWLQKSGLFDIKVIHLVKRPSAFVYSTAKGKQQGMNPVMVARMTLRWIIENKIMSKVCDQCISPENVYTLQYEELAQDPDKALSLIGERFGINLNGYSTNQFREYQNFGVSGNKSRWENRSIFLDEKWKKHMPSKHIKFVNLWTQKLASRYGYKIMG
ncbi:sulfotransferase [Catalinimonas sp. 4WD22]|uniref:sulfotransferase n=1 Tax=Catalinimonas locisalis TaxID=3133978 RepID=UPI003101583C